MVTQRSTPVNGERGQPAGRAEENCLLSGAPAAARARWRHQGRVGGAFAGATQEPPRSAGSAGRCAEECARAEGCAGIDARAFWRRVSSPKHRLASRGTLGGIPAHPPPRSGARLQGGWGERIAHRALHLRPRCAGIGARPFSKRSLAVSAALTLERPSRCQSTLAAVVALQRGIPTHPPPRRRTPRCSAFTGLTCASRAA